MEDVKVLFIFGLVLVIFGYWWKLTMYWNIKNTPWLEKRLEEIEINNEEFKDLKYNEKIHIKLRDTAPEIFKFCFILGSLMTVVGFMSILFF